MSGAVLFSLCLSLSSSDNIGEVLELQPELDALHVGARSQLHISRRIYNGSNRLRCVSPLVLDLDEFLSRIFWVRHIYIDQCNSDTFSFTFRFSRILVFYCTT
ncbi:hypothetical protein SISSUDRAFT_435899 [Sistotremastrum suecicum HHB10207 ss-3]|uniref:Uncharacterized protein n=1 Tax=Sistotremastrum suecicum HHB10207 ss-3 TaxID=1314776 RepID=A0A165YF57_9AGAM|nr:hypothetical protein SISSUDRAFT_435899 [Sistotremastrum suecicum HHB10207 ss-3]